jgi:hypothetical protein
MKNRLLPIAGLIACMTFLASTFPVKAIANIQPVVTYDGWTGTEPGQECSDRNCDSDQTGCSTLVHQWDEYWTQYRCKIPEQGPPEEGGPIYCTQFLKKCRETKTFTGIEGNACGGTLLQWSINWYGACS